MKGENAVPVGVVVSIPLTVSVARSPQLVVEMHDAFEWPGRGFGRYRGGDASAALHVGEERLYAGAEILETRRVRMQLLERLLVHQP